MNCGIVNHRIVTFCYDDPSPRGRIINFDFFILCQESIVFDLDE